jgi:hypothetical protein
MVLLCFWVRFGSSSPEPKRPLQKVGTNYTCKFNLLTYLWTDPTECSYELLLLVDSNSPKCLGVARQNINKYYYELASR